MTAQRSDLFIYEGREFQIAGVSGQGLFNPLDHGIRTWPCTTALWRGFHCKYALSKNKLILKELEICHEGDPPSIFGVSLVEPERTTSRRAVFQDLAWPLAYEGGMLLGAEFIRQLYVHMGFHPPWKYRKVMELIFKEGVLIETHDRSEQMAQVRERMQEQDSGS